MAKFKPDQEVWVKAGSLARKATVWHAYINHRHELEYCIWVHDFGECHIDEGEIIRERKEDEEVYIDEEALDMAAREEWAVRCHTNGPRVLQEYACKELMDANLLHARRVVEEYLKRILKLKR